MSYHTVDFHIIGFKIQKIYQLHLLLISTILQLLDFMEFFVHRCSSLRLGYLSQ